jgi:hypothetical protein
MDAILTHPALYGVPSMRDIPPDNIESAATSEGVPIAPSLGATIERARMPVERSQIDGRVVLVCALAVGLAIVTGVIAQLLVAIIGVVTNISFYGRFSFEPHSPALRSET